MKLREDLFVFGTCFHRSRRWFNPLRWILGKEKRIDPVKVFNKEDE